MKKTILLGVLLLVAAASIPFVVESLRDLKQAQPAEVIHPQTFDLIGRALPMPGTGIGAGVGSVPLPGLGNLPPIPGIGSGVVFGTIPGPGNVIGSVPLPLPLPLPAVGTGPLPMPNIGSGVGSGVGIGSFPLPGAGNGVGLPGLPSPMDFCAVPSLGCVRVQPINAPPLGHTLGGASNTPLPFP